MVLIVLDSVGIGEAPDAADYGDTGSATLQHIGEAVNGLDLPTLASGHMGSFWAVNDSSGQASPKRPHLPESRSSVTRFCGQIRPKADI